MSEFQNYDFFLSLNIVSTLANSVDSDAVFNCLNIFSTKWVNPLCIKGSILPVYGLTLYAPKDYSFWFDTLNMGWSITYIEGSKVVTSI